MSDTSKGKVASLTGSLLARKGTATPAGFTRLHPGERDLPVPVVTTPEVNVAPNEADGNQPSLDLGAGILENRDGGAEERWAPLSQIVIRPHPFTSAEPTPVPAAEVTPRITSIGDIGIEPSLLANPALLLPVTPLGGESSEHVIVETPLVPPALHRNEPILAVPKLQRDSGGEDGVETPADVDLGEYEELAAPTLGPARRDWEQDPEVREGVGAAATISLDADREPSGRPASEPHLAPQQTTPPALAESPVEQIEEKAPPEPIVLPKSAPVLAPVVAQRTTSRAEVPKPKVVPPIRIGELQARARVIPVRTRRRRRVRPVVYAILALAIFFGVTWQAYRTNQDGGGIVSTVGPDGEPTIWATVDELGYAVSQILAAVTGRRGSDVEEGSRLASGADGTTPSPIFVPAGPVATEAQTTDPDIAGADRVLDDIGEAPVETAAVEAEAEPIAEPVVVVARPVTQEPLPAPPVPVAPIVNEETVAVAPLRPVGVSAPPPPPLDVDTAAVASGGGADVATALVLEEVDTAITLEPLAPAVVAVAAGVGRDGIDDSGAADVPADPALATATEVAALPVDSGAVAGPGDIALDSAGVPVLKP
ncbi:MAG: hypothetical protein ACTSX7_08845, partial [Alphaproteobacteria bacterium]